MVESEHPVVECVLNVSEGRNLAVLDEMNNILERPGRNYVLHRDIGFDVNRTVFTIVGILEELFLAIDDLMRYAIKSCDIEVHSGAHPHLGVLDVIPFIPIKNISFEELQLSVKAFASKIGNKYQIPIYYYGLLSSDPKRITLAQLRKGGIERIKREIGSSFPPDSGPNHIHPSQGASCVTVRDFMAAYNINISASDLKHARRLSKMLIEERKNKDNSYSLDTGDVRFLAWYMPQFGTYQISTNIYDIEKVDLYSLYRYIETMALKIEISLKGAELIGLVPLRAICKKEMPIDEALSYINLKSVKPFDLEKNILEYQLGNLKWH